MKKSKFHIFVSKFLRQLVMVSSEAELKNWKKSIAKSSFSVRVIDIVTGWINCSDIWGCLVIQKSSRWFFENAHL